MSIANCASLVGLAARRIRAPWLLARALVLLALGLLLPAPLAADGVRILEDDREALQARADLIARAQSRVELSYFCIGNDDVALAYLALLRDAARRGVRVRVLVDAMHNEIPRPVVASLSRAGIQVREYHPPRLDRPGWIPTRLHDKLLLIDEREMITGGRNLESRYFGFDEVNFRDRDIYVSGEAAAAASRYFDAIWDHKEVAPVVMAAAAPRRPKVPAASHRIAPAQASPTAISPAAVERQLDAARAALATRCGVELPVGVPDPPPSYTTGPVTFLFDPPGEKSQGPGISEDLERLIGGAVSSIEIETPYLVLSERFRAVLAAARGRGVSVRITTNSLASTNSLLAQAAYTAQRDEMQRLGIDLWEYRGPRCLHAKSFVLDGRRSIIGSFNLDPRSELRDTQVAVLIDDPHVATHLASLHEGNRANANPVAGGVAPLSPPDVQAKRKALFGVSRILWPLVKDEL